MGRVMNKACGRSVGRVIKGVWTICGQSYQRRVDDLWAELSKACGRSVGRVIKGVGRICLWEQLGKTCGGSVCGHSHVRRVEDLSVDTVM